MEYYGKNEGPNYRNAQQPVPFSFPFPPDQSTNKACPGSVPRWRKQSADKQNLFQCTNIATRRYSMVNLDVPVAYGTDLDHAIEVMNRVGIELAEDENWKERLIEAPQVLRVNNFGDFGIDIRIAGRVQPHEKWAVTGELRLCLKKAFDKEDIEIPWPHTKVYFGNMPNQQGIKV